MERPFPAYEGTEPFIFICYAHDDTGQVYPEITRLRDAGFHIWYDEGISPGSEWSEELAARIQECAVFLYFVTPRSVEREHCRAELNFALSQRCTILSVHLEPTDVPAALQLSLSHRQGILKHEHSARTYEKKLDRALEAAALGRTVSDREVPARILDIGDWRLDTGTQRLTRGEEEHQLELKELSVLLHLAEAAPEVVTTEALLDRNWPGAVVGDNALHRVIGRLRRAFSDDARNPSYIETLPKRGYRLMARVSYEQPSAPNPAGTGSAAIEAAQGTKNPERSAGTSWRKRPNLLAAAAALLALAAGLSWVTRSLPVDEQREEPFAIQSAAVGFEPVRFAERDSALEAFATVIELDLVTELEKIDVDVIANRSSDRADYLIGIVLRRLTEGVEVTLQITNSSNGILVWSKNKIVNAKDDGLDKFLYAQQFAFLAAVAMAFDGELRESTTPKAKREYVKGVMEHVQVLLGGDGDLGAAERYLRAAIAADPDFVSPYDQIGILYKNRMGGTIPYEKAIKGALASAERVLSKFPNWTMTLGRINSGLELDYKAAIANLEAARNVGCCDLAGQTEWEIASTVLWSGDVNGALRRLEIAERMGAGVNQDAINWTRLIAYLATDRYLDASLIAQVSNVDLDHPTDLGIGINVLRVISYFLSGQVDLANQTFDLLWEKHGRERPELLVRTLALLGHDDEARRVIDENEIRFNNDELGVMSQTFWAAYYLEDYELAYKWLDRTIENREYWFLPWFHHSKLLDPIRESPRFQAAMERLEEIEAIGTKIQSYAYP